MRTELEDPPDSKTDGSDGGGPSIAHRRDSYFDRMKDSTLLLCQHAIPYACPPQFIATCGMADPSVPSNPWLLGENAMNAGKDTY